MDFEFKSQCVVQLVVRRELNQKLDGSIPTCILTFRENSAGKDIR